jgi:uncharacterized protein YjiS (DUF1127 family)
MTIYSTNAGNVRRHAPSLAQIVCNWLRKSAERRRLHLERIRLSRMPRHLLRDIGLEHLAAEDDPEPWRLWR